MAAPVLHVGCPMWAHRPWVGRSIPASTRHGAELAAYSQVVNAVEGNTTFYASPSPATTGRNTPRRLTWPASRRCTPSAIADLPVAGSPPST